MAADAWPNRPKRRRGDKNDRRTAEHPSRTLANHVAEAIKIRDARKQERRKTKHLALAGGSETQRWRRMEVPSTLQATRQLAGRAGEMVVMGRSPQLGC